MTTQIFFVKRRNKLNLNSNSFFLSFPCVTVAKSHGSSRMYRVSHFVTILPYILANGDPWYIHELPWLLVTVTPCGDDTETQTHTCFYSLNIFLSSLDFAIAVWFVVFAYLHFLYLHFQKSYKMEDDDVWQLINNDGMCAYLMMKKVFWLIHEA